MTVIERNGILFIIKELDAKLINRSRNRKLGEKYKNRSSNIGISACATACCTKRSVTVGTPRFLVPPSGFGISTRLTGCGLYFLVCSCSLMFSPFSERYTPSSSTVIPSTPAAPLFLTTCRYAVLRLSLLNICSMRLLVSMRCFLSAPFALAAFDVIDRRCSGYEVERTSTD